MRLGRSASICQQLDVGKNGFLGEHYRTCKGPEAQLTLLVDPELRLYILIWDLERVRHTDTSGLLSHIPNLNTLPDTRAPYHR